MAGDHKAPDSVEAVPNADMEAQRKPVLRSRDSYTRSFVRFVNRTMRQVDVVWLNYEGGHVKYRTLKPDEFVDINTFVDHPWIFRDNCSGDKLIVTDLNSEVYMPIGWQPEDGRPTRRVVLITIPVYSLKERSLQVVRHLVPDKDIAQLEIPNTLRDELRKNNHIRDMRLYNGDAH